MAAQRISVVVFDLGGVLLKLRPARATFGLDADDTSFNRTWLMSPSVRGFERGDIDENQFARQIVAELGLNYSSQDFMRRFRAWPDRLYDGVVEILEKMPATTRTALLSNTNPVHWSGCGIRKTLAPRLDHIFLSYETGLLKPDATAFTQVIRHFDCAADRILFLDDNPLNIQAAARLGIVARLTQGVQQLLEVLREERVLPDTHSH